MAAPFGSDRRAVITALSRAQPTDCPTDMRDGLRLAASLVGARPDATIYVISDGAFAPLPEIRSTARAEFLRVGQRAGNVALLAFEAARHSGTQKTQLSLRVANFGTEPKRTVLTISLEGEALEAERLGRPPGKNRTLTYSLALTQPGLLRAQLDAADSLVADNVAYTFAEPPGVASVLLVTPGSIFLEQGLLVLPEVTVSKTASLSAADAPGAYDSYGAVIFDRVPAPAEPKRGAVMLIGAPGRGEPAAGAEVTGPWITRWDEQQPVLLHVNLAAVAISRGIALTPAPGATCSPRATAGRSSERSTAPAGGRSRWAGICSTPPFRCGSVSPCHLQTRSGGSPMGEANNARRPPAPGRSSPSSRRRM